MSHSLGMAIESLVAVLLILTIGYCMLLNSRLKRLKADEHSLKAVIGELITATEIAERAIGGLKQTVRDVNEHLGNQLATAGQMSQQLKQQLAEGDYVVRRLTKIAIAARPSNATEPEAKADMRADLKADIRTDAPKVSAAKATAAAAQAFLDRKRSDGLAA
jgi:L-2-hydroxyglutarate oxidase LhgO